MTPATPMPKTTCVSATPNDLDRISFRFCLPVPFVCSNEAFHLVVVSAENLDDPIAGQDLVRHLGDLTDRILDTSAVAAEGAAENVESARR